MYKELNVKKRIEEMRQASETFDKAWEESREEYRLIGEMIALRKEANISQGALAEKIGTKQQVISRLEKHENVPSLKMFCNAINALGYELQIVKKDEMTKYEKDKILSEILSET